MRDDDQRAPGVIPEAAVARHDRRGWRLQSVNRGPSVKSAHSYCTPDHLLNPRGHGLRSNTLDPVVGMSDLENKKGETR